VEVGIKYTGVNVSCFIMTLGIKPDKTGKTADESAKGNKQDYYITIPALLARL